MARFENSGWRRLDPDDFIYRVLNRLPNRRQAVFWGTLFISLKWISFVSSVNDLILQSKPVKWLVKIVGSEIVRELPNTAPYLRWLSNSIDRWALYWRSFVSPIYQALSILKVLHIPEIFVAIGTDIFVLFALPLFAFFGSLVTSRSIRAEARKLRSEFDRKVQQTQSPNILESRRSRASEWMQIYGHTADLEYVAKEVRRRGIERFEERQRAPTRSKSEQAQTAERQKIGDQINRLEKLDPTQVLIEASPSELRSDRPFSLDKSDLESFIQYMQGKHLGLMFSDKETIGKNLKLLHAQHAINFQIFRAVGLSSVLAIFALILRVVGQIWF